MFFAPGLPFFGAYKILVPIFYALKDTRTPVRISIRIVGLNFMLNVLFILSWPDGFKHAGLMFATVLSSGTNAIILGILLHRRIGSPGWRALARRAAVVLVVSAWMGVVVYVIQSAVAGGLVPGAWLEPIPAAWRAKGVQALAVGLAILGGVGVYAATAGVVFRRVGRV
jgi:putative peptidoglycan lipid II flippase